MTQQRNKRYKEEPKRNFQTEKYNYKSLAGLTKRKKKEDEND